MKLLRYGRWIALAAGLVIVLSTVAIVTRTQVDLISYSQFVDLANGGEVLSSESSPLTFTGNRVRGRYLRADTGEERDFQAILPPKTAGEFANQFVDRGVVVALNADESTWLADLLRLGLPLLLIVALGVFLFRRMSAGKGAMTFGKSKAKLSLDRHKKTTFGDVAGVHEAKEELEEIVEFLKEPQKFQKLGGRIPKGVLLIGPPGTGKTLLARAIAGEASVPFFSVSASEFVEMFVGIGASRVRDLFEQGRKNSPCIIFVDEIDAVGRRRGAGLGSGHDEREQTLNQLLTEMDGFEPNEGVILIAATNRPDVLDPALLRPGRFDRQVMVALPDIKGREGILRIHTRLIPLDEDVELSVVARGTSGFSGAQLASMANEAALRAAILKHETVRMVDLEESRDRILMGKERRSLVVCDRDRRNRAYYEAGRAVIACLLPDADPLHKVTIIPRGRALGRTVLLPREDVYLQTQEGLEAAMTVLLAGRGAEEMFLGESTTGASDDLERVSQLARRMVCLWGMSEELGPINLGSHEEPVFLAQEITRSHSHGQETAVKIDRAVSNLVLMVYERARRLLERHSNTVSLIATALLEEETLEGSRVHAALLAETSPV